MVSNPDIRPWFDIRVAGRHRKKGGERELSKKRGLTGQQAPKCILGRI